ncbi:hypothetical protein CLOBOL_01213 [Enterocloster bolteae ATCC BAA-613]|uniref:Uncharacterized protein n=1 Tax=Enterocloster bolteae (strain ATCC BAA-613 / DSM 15670 / CCUG 46953 / JCM 12243 / WAL 16351) TaxID=411902 RepID=A8RK60_ENTBW|nr:hypothetical protein CLOBOL_01213 [Enterocloster bolteae ATCC BAA-613]
MRFFKTYSFRILIYKTGHLAISQSSSLNFGENSGTLFILRIFPL